MKILLLLTSILFLQGCLSSHNYYILSVAPTPNEIYHSQDKIIGVEKVTLPSYLYKREIAIAHSPQEITLLPNALWAEDLDSGLTQRLIGFLQKKFNQPDVYAYPWGVIRQVDIKVSVNISRFIIEKDSVYLEASWSLEALESTHRISKLFDIKVASTNETKDIVIAMDKAFSALENAIAIGIKKF